MADKPKYRIEKNILDILRAVQKKDGMGRVVLEVEEIVSDCMFVFFSLHFKIYNDTFLFLFLIFLFFLFSKRYVI